MKKIKQTMVKEKQIKLLLDSEGWKLRNDLQPSGGENTYIELADGRLLSFWSDWDAKKQIFSSSKRKGWVMDSVETYIHKILPTFKKLGVSQHAIVPHNHYFKTWDAAGTAYIQDLLTVLPVKPELLDFSPESLLAIDKVIKRKKLPDNVLDDSIFLPAVVGYCGVHLERFDNREILIDYDQHHDIYEPYYMDGDRKEPLYIRFYEEASENGRKFSLDEIVDVNFF